MNEPDWVADFRSALLVLDENLSKHLRVASLEEACNTLVSVNKLKAEIAVVYDSVVAKVSHLMDQQAEVNLEDGSKVEKRWASDRKGWQHQELAATVAQRLLQSSVDMDTGEILYTQEQIIAQLLDYVQPSYWRVKELQKIGINADMYCEVGETKSSIIVRKAK